MSNILLVNYNVKDYQKIINACNDNTYAITYNQQTDTYNTIFTKYEKLVSENNIRVLNHLALVSHGSNNPEFIFLEKENKMLISQYLEDLSTAPSENVDNETSVLDDTTEEYDASSVYYPTAEEEFLIWNSHDTLPEEGVENEYISSESSLNSMNKLIINNLDTWTTFKEFIKKFNIQISLDFLGCAILLSDDWKYVLNTLEKEEYLNLNIRASDDITGNLKVGGNWVLESDNVNIKELYFINESIEKWYYTLDTTNFAYTGSVAYYTVPNNINSIDVKVWGADGGSGGYYSVTGVSYSPGGTGGYSEGTLSVTPGEVLYIYVGGRGYNWYNGGQTGYNGTLNKPASTSSADGGWGGSAGYGNGGNATKYGMSGGGGASQIRSSNSSSSSDKSSILILAGGGGGGGNPGTNQPSKGGDGGGTTGQTAPAPQYINRLGGIGGGQTAGNNGDGNWSSTGDGYPHGTNVSIDNIQGGGGGGYYGGGQRDNSTGGGGGSSYISHSRLSNSGTYTGSSGYTNPASANPLTGDVDGKKHGYIRIITTTIQTIPTSNISLSILKAKYVEYDVVSGEGDSYLRDSSTTSTIKLSYFNGVKLSDNTIIQEPISFSDFSGKGLLQGYDYPIFIFSTSFRSQTSFSISSTTSYGANKKVTLITSGQTSYGNILPIVEGVSGNNAPAISSTSDYNIWLKLTANSTGNYMIGLINRESWRTNWTSCVSDNYKIKTQHAMYADRIMFHSYGYFTYSGNYKPSGTDPVLGSAYSGLGSIFYNKMGYTAGTGGVTSTGQTFVLNGGQRFKPTALTSYVNSIAIGDHIGIRIKYFTATITATVTNGQNFVVISSQNLDNVFSGMRVSGTSIPANSVLGDVYTDRIYLRDEYTGLLKNSSGTNGTYTLNLSGQLMQFRKSNSSFNDDLLFGPPHVVLPLKYSTVNNNTTPNGDITDWSLIIGDTNGSTNSEWAFEIIDDKPVLPEPSWSYTYSATAPPPVTYNFTNLNGGTSYTGPTSTTGYNSTSLQGKVTISGGIQQWSVPTTGAYTIEAWGASGGDGTVSGDGHGTGTKPATNRYGGVGRNVKITTTLTQGSVIYILVGQGGHRNYTRCGGGGGGTFVTTTAPSSSATTSYILVIAGGGGGGGRGFNSSTGQSPEINARGVGDDGGYSYDYHTSGLQTLGGTSGGGGQYSTNSTRKAQGSTGGGGFSGDGTIGYGSRAQDVGKSWKNGGLGGQGSVSGSDYGGFGGGGSQPHQNHVGGGGGGGYNGGAPGGNYNGAWSGGGGSSYASVTPDSDVEWSHTRNSIVSGPGRHGKVTITGPS